MEAISCGSVAKFNLDGHERLMRTKDMELDPSSGVLLMVNIFADHLANARTQPRVELGYRDWSENFFSGASCTDLGIASKMLSPVWIAVITNPFLASMFAIDQRIRLLYTTRIVQNDFRR
jgi:hypothetical protein